MTDENFADFLRKVKPRVDKLLELHARARDDDKFLYLLYMRTYCEAGKLHGENFDDFAKWVMGDEVPPPETVRRTRQKIQEEGRWRGEKYEARQRKAKPVADWAAQG